MVYFLINRPIGVIMTFLAFTIIGIFATLQLPVSLLPNVDIPEVTVQINYPNSTARELENNIVKPIRLSLQQIQKVDDVTCLTQDGYAIVQIKFAYGVNTHLASIETNEKIDAIMASMPRDMERPKVIPARVTDIPVLVLSVCQSDTKSDNFLAFSQFVQNVLKRRIEQLESITMCDISGIALPQIRITPNIDKLRMYNITYNDIQKTLTDNNINFGNMLLQQGHYQYHVQLSNYLRTTTDVENIYVKINDRILQLKDIAKIDLTVQKPKGICLANNKRAIKMNIIKQTGVKLETLKTELYTTITSLKEQYPEVEFDMSQDQTQIIESTVSNLKQDFIMGSIVAFIIMFMFIKDIKSPLLIGFTIPTSIVLTLFLMYITHLSINIITLSGLILSAGMMIDNSVIVIDNINQYLEKKYTLEDSITKGVNDVIKPLLSSMLTNVAIFMPLIYLSGISGALFYEQAVTICISLIVSLLIAITLLPTLFRLLYKKYPTKQSSSEPTYGKLEKWYDLSFNFFFKYKYTTLCLCLLFFLFIPLFFTITKKEKMPELSSNEMVVNIDWNENINLTENYSRTLALLNIQSKKILQSNSNIGKQQFILNTKHDMDYSQNQIWVRASSSDNIKFLQHEFSYYLKKNYPNASIIYRKPENLFEKIFADNQSPLILKLRSKQSNYTPDFTILDSIINILKYNDIYISNPPPLKTIYEIKIDNEKLLIYNVSYDQLKYNLQTQFDELQIGTLKSYQEYIPIVFSNNTQILSDILKTCFVTNTKQEEIPLSELIKISQVDTYKYLTSDKDGEFVGLDIKNNDESTNKICAQISKLFDMNSDLTLDFAGSFFTGKKLVNELFWILLISCILLYFILASQFESLLQPLIILFEIPFDIAFCLLVLYLFDMSLNLMSVAGMIVMTGIVMNDSILKIDTINLIRKQNTYNLIESIHEGGRRRLKSILSTSLNSILSLLPVFIFSDLGSELQKPLAVVLISGMSIGTFVSIYIIPLIYWLFQSQKLKQSCL